MTFFSFFKKKFFTKAQESAVVKAIREAEANTSGEIRVHLSARIQTDVMNDAALCFSKLKMDNTERRNGVLIFIVPSARQFAIIGDQGFHAIAGDDFWQNEKQIIGSYFEKGQFTEGLVEGIAAVGALLKKHFPREDNDINELDDEISYGE